MGTCVLDSPSADGPQGDDPVLEVRVHRFIEAVSRRPHLAEAELPATRRLVEAAQNVEQTRPGVEIRDVEIPGGPSGAVWARVLRPRSVIGALPAIVYMHGGGWVLGSVRTHERVLRDIVVETGAVVIAPMYSLSPEARYPTALEECYAVLRHFAGTSRGLGVDRSRIAVAGDGAGGNLAAALALLAKARGGPRLAAQVLLCPWVDGNPDDRDTSDPPVGEFPRREELEWCWRQYATTPARSREITVSPVLASADQLAGLPPALVITAEVDVTRDAAEWYARRMRAAGVSVLSVRYDGTISDFLVINCLSSTSAAKAALAQATTFISSALR
jgi:acetyl esterase/lipase